MEDQTGQAPRESGAPSNGGPFDPATGVRPGATQVLVIGASATERESVARALHRNHKGEDGTFMRLRCPQDNTLLQHELRTWLSKSEDESPPRLLTRLSAGSLFLDNVEALDSESQKLLLAFLEGGRTGDEPEAGGPSSGGSWKGQL